MKKRTTTIKNVRRCLCRHAVGPENAKKADEIAALVGLAPTRENVEVWNAIRSLQFDGHAICARTAGAHRGFFVATSRGQVIEFTDSLDRRISSVREKLGALLRTAEKWPDVPEPSPNRSAAAVRSGGAR